MKSKILIHLMCSMFILIVISCSKDDDSCVNICLDDAQKTRVINFVNKAVSYTEDNGTEKAFTAFTAPNPSADFIDDELYIFVADITHLDTKIVTMPAHGTIEELTKRDNVYDIKGERGKYVVQELIKATDGQGGKGWYWYHWKDKTDRDKVKKKFSYVVKYKNFIIGAGTYLR